MSKSKIANMSFSGGKKSNRYDPWYAKAAFVLLCVLVGSLVALYSGVPVAQFMTHCRPPMA